MVKRFALLFLFAFNYCVFFGQEASQKNNSLDYYSQKRKAFYKANKLDSALVYAQKIIPVAVELNDSLLLQKTFFKIGYYHDQLNNDVESFKNYNKGLKIALLRRDTLEISKFYNNIATKQYRFSDYNVCEQTIVEHLKLLKSSKFKSRKFKAFNLLANCYKSSRNYEQAIATFEKMEPLISDTRNKFTLQNNLALVHFEKGDFNKAKLIYQDILKNDSIHKYLKLKARVLDNLGFTEFNIQSKSGLKFMNDGIQLRQQENDLLGLYASNIHLSKYHNKNNQSDLATVYANHAYNLAIKLKNYESQIEALQLLVQLNPQSKLLNRFLFLNDSLQNIKQRQKNQYAGLKFQTEEKEKENLQLKADNSDQALLTQKANTRNWMLVLGLLTLGISTFFIWKRYKSEAKAKQTISDQKDVIEELQKELHHRVKNNLNIIDAFVDEIKDDYEDSELEDKLEELQNRIASINEVHTQLYQSTDVINVNIKKYIESLAKNVASTYHNKNVSVSQQIKEDLNLQADKSSVLGLIINEFLTNSYKYAFENEGEIKVNMNETKEDYILKLSDNGKGLPKDFDINTVGSYGLRIMKLLARQLRGTFEIKNNNGVELNIQFPKA